MAKSDTQLAILSRLNFRAYYERYVSIVSEDPKNYIALCPFHSEKTPSFYIHKTEGLYKCFGCNASGDVFSFQQRIRNGQRYRDAEKELADICGYEIKVELSSSGSIHNKKFEWPLIDEVTCDKLHSDLTQEIRDYL